MLLGAGYARRWSIAEVEKAHELIESSKKQRGQPLNNKYSLLYLKVKGINSRLLTDLSDLLEQIHLG